MDTVSGRRVGRPFHPHYLKVISKLDYYTLYSAASIADFGKDHRFFSPQFETATPERLALERRRLRICLGRHSNNRRFPDEGDGWVTLRGQAPTPAWFGWRWQAAFGLEESGGKVQD